MDLKQTTEAIVKAIDDILDTYEGDELPLMQFLCNMAESWRMRRQELSVEG